VALDLPAVPLTDDAQEGDGSTDDGSSTPAIAQQPVPTGSTPPTDTSGFWGNLFSGNFNAAAHDALYPVLGDVPEATNDAAGTTTWLNPATGATYTQPAGQPPQNTGPSTGKFPLAFIGTIVVGLLVVIYVLRPANNPRLIVNAG
jgi:hypothetical protein